MAREDAVNMRHSFMSIIEALASIDPATEESLEDGITAYWAGDFAAALRVRRPIAEQGDAEAQLNLGVMSYNGDGAPQDNVLAHMWFSLAAAQGDADGVKNRDIAASLMTPAQIAEAQKLAQGWMAAEPQ